MDPISSSPTNKPFKTPDKKLQTHEEKSNQVYKKTDLNQESSNKDISATQEAKNPKVERVAYQKNLQQYKESPDEPDFNEADTEEISQALDRFFSPLDENSAFSDTDLILIHDSFTGTMPLNGLRKNELEHIEQVFKNICQGKEKIKISADLNDSFKSDTENLIKILLTRNIGRKLIQKILDDPCTSKINIISSKKNQQSFELIDGKASILIELYRNPNESIYRFYHYPNGKVKAEKSSFLIILAHELIHATHYPVYLSKANPTFSQKYDDLEEQLTITGLKHDLSLENDKSEDDSWEPSKGLTQDLKENYDELNEWNISVAFTNSQNIYYPRISHRSMKLNNSLPLVVDDLDKLEELDLKNLRDDIRSLAAHGALNDLEKINIDFHKLFEKESIPLIYSSLLSGDIPTIQFFVDMGFDVTQKSDFYQNASDYLIQHISKQDILDYYQIFEYLIKNNVNITLSSVSTLMYLYEKNSYNQKFQDLIKLIFNDYTQSLNFSIPFGVLDDLEAKLPEPHKLKNWLENGYQLPERPSKVNKELVKILLENLVDNTNNFLIETHSIDEIRTKWEDLNSIATELENKGYNITQLKNSLSKLQLKKTNELF